MLKYKITKVSVPAGGEVSATAFSIPDGKKYTLRAIILTGATTDSINLFVNDTKIAELRDDTDIGYGTSIPLNIELKNQEDVIINGVDNGYGAADLYIIIAYEEE